MSSGREGSFSHSSCPLAGWAYWGAGKSCYVGPLGENACWAQLQSIKGLAEHLQGACANPGLCLVQFLWFVLVSHETIGPGEVGEDVEWSMWWCWRNSVSSSKVNGGPLSIESRDSGLYWEMSSSWCTHRDWTEFVETFNGRDAYWTNCRLINILYPCGWGNLLQSPARGHQVCL